ncbi:MAG TPA: cyclase family protein [Phycisphaerales bacterium]|nr:cyclase family protein [Phycisphaerales bacterium]
MPPRLYDVTPPITPNLAIWPGDTPPSREILCDIARGDNITLSTLRATVHLGAHADGANHYGHPAPSIDAMPLGRYLGPCRVITANAPRGTRVGESHLSAPLDSIDADATPRVLIRTNTYPDPTNFNRDFAALEPALVESLAHRGVFLIGIDTPSVDLCDSKDLPAHKMFLKHDVSILEGIVLTEVPDGVYELIALPLKLVGFDASPVRAVLRALE